MTNGSKLAPVGLRPGGDAALAVVHLVREANGIEPFALFLDSYKRHRSGAEHELVLLLKGFADEQAAAAYLELAHELGPVVSLQLPDDGFDLGAYRRAAEALPHRRLALLNSFSEILADDWLGIMLGALDRPGVAAVAASGSWGSHVSHMRYELGLGGPYGRVFSDRRETHRVFARLAGVDPEGRGRPVLSQLHQGAVIGRQLIGFAEFPAPHVRTNGLLLDRLSWLRACKMVPHDKLQAHRLESGRRGITRRLSADGSEVLIAGRDGGVFTSAEWPRSITFWQGDQRNLLIGDNQTRAYERGDLVTRRVLSRYAWGLNAAVAESSVAEVA
jgi:hypothetical protein